MTPEDDPSARRFDELLPWFLNGRLDEPDRQWMRAHLRDRPDAAARVQQHRAVRDAVHDTLEGEAAALPFDLGWREYAARHGLVDAAAPTPARGARPGDRSRWWAGMAWLVMLVQGAAIALLLQREPDAPWARERSGAAPLATDTADLVVTFLQDTSEGQIRQLLLELNARIVNGPTQAGEYRLRLPSGDAAAAIAALRGSPLVRSVEQP